MGFSIIYSLKLKDFLKVISKYKIDSEKYYNLKDQILFN